MILSLQHAFIFPDVTSTLLSTDYSIFPCCSYSPSSPSLYYLNHRNTCSDAGHDPLTVSLLSHPQTSSTYYGAPLRSLRIPSSHSPRRRCCLSHRRAAPPTRDCDQSPWLRMATARPWWARCDARPVQTRPASQSLTLNLPWACTPPVCPVEIDERQHVLGNVMVRRERTWNTDCDDSDGNGTLLQQC